MLVVSAIWSMSREHCLTWLIAAATPVTWWVRVSTSASRLPISANELRMWAVPSLSWSMARWESRRDSSQACATRS